MARKSLSLILALFITLGLVLTMWALIKMKDAELEEKEKLKLPSISAAARDENLDVITAKPDRPDDVLEQPDVPDVQVTPDKIDINADIALGAVKLGINKDLKGFDSNDGEYLPIFRAPPIYPRRAQERGLCGHVDLSFTVTAAGGVRDPIVTASSSSIFEKAAKKAALKYKYKPRQEGGKPVDVSGVEVRVKFEMEGGC